MKDAMIHTLPLPENFNLSTSHNRGLILDTLWKKAIVAEDPTITIPKEDDAPYDALIDGIYTDVKLITIKDHKVSASYAYISHNEYLFGKEHDTTFVIYEEGSTEAELIAVFPFSYVKEIGAFDTFPNGKKVHCKATGQLETPWSINVTRVRDWLLNQSSVPKPAFYFVKEIL
jgi:hypothetical protein